MPLTYPIKLFLCQHHKSTPFLVFVGSHHKSKKSVDFFIYPTLDTLFGTVSEVLPGHWI